jgi:hypothetical protein
MTLFVCGFLADIERWDDDYPVDKLEYHLSELKETRFDPFEIEVGGANTLIERKKRLKPYYSNNYESFPRNKTDIHM